MKASDLIFGLMVSLDLPEFSFRELGELTSPFEISTTSLRTSLSRMQHKGILDSVRKNKQVYYSLTARGKRISGNVALSFQKPDWNNWQQQWWGFLYSVPELQKPERYRIRKKLSAYRFASLYPGFWIRPLHPEEQIPERLADLAVAPYCRILSFIPHTPFNRDEVARLWNLAEIQAEFKVQLELIRTGLAGTASLDAETAFRAKMITGDKIVHTLFRDPLLPPEYLPDDWQGDALRQTFRLFISTMNQLARPFWQSIIRKRGE